MQVLELKNRVKDRLEAVNDESLLEEILYLIDFESDKEETFEIPPQHLKQLEISLEQMKNGEVISNEEVDEKVQKWLSK
jgi:hypothetical protein